MLIYDLAIVEDRGAYYQVTGLTKNTFDNLADRDEKYLKLSSAAYKLIDDAVSAGKIVRLPKALQVDEVMPGEVDIIAAELNPLDAARTAALVKARRLVTPEYTKISGYILYDFMCMNNELASEGYFITNKNREEQYIKIIETGDERMIALLEKYLEARDTIDTAASMKLRLDAFQAKIETLTTADDIQAAEAEFLTNFFANN